jgi:DNA-binding transcriptional regulator/RsmH inhibitor MraZ
MAATALPFYRTVRSDLVVYGCRGGELFEQQLETHDEYDRVTAAIDEDLAESARQQQLDHVRRLLDDISRDEIRSY